MTDLTPIQISEAVQDALIKDNARSVIALSNAFITIEMILGIMCFIVGWGVITAPVGFTLLGLTILSRQIGVMASR